MQINAVEYHTFTDDRVLVHGVMNLEIDGFQYRIKQTFIILRKIYT